MLLANSNKPQASRTLWIRCCLVFVAGCSSNAASSQDDGGTDASAPADARVPDASGSAASDSRAASAEAAVGRTQPDGDVPLTITGIGDSCLFGSDCPPGSNCDYLFCSKACSSDGDCVGSHTGGQNAQGTPNLCVVVINASGAAVPICDPGCHGANDCLALGQYCRSSSAFDAGIQVMACWQTP